MNTTVLLEGLRTCVEEIPFLKEMPDGFHNPKVKSWKTRLEGLLRDGGKTCTKSLESVRNFNIKLGGSDFIKRQTYINQLDAINRTLKQAIQTIEVLGRPEDKRVTVDWAAPKSALEGSGYIKIGEEKVSTDTITIEEVFTCMQNFVKDSNDLASEMKDEMLKNLNAITENSLLEPFLNQKICKLLAYWSYVKNN